VLIKKTNKSYLKGKFMHSDVDIVKSRTNIVDIVGEYVKLTKAGSSFKACCPFHQEKTPSFNVNEEKQMYHCFGCGVGGDVFSFVMEIENIGFREALEMLADKAGVELQNNFSQDASKSQTQKKQMFDILSLATKFYQKQLWDGIGKKQAYTYLKERGLSDEVIRQFQLGFAPDGWNYIEKFLKSKNYNIEMIVQTGLVIKSDRGTFYDRFRNRIMFPISDAMGRVIGFTSRVLPGDDESQAKYINTPETFLYHKSSVLYGIDQAKQAIKQEGRVVVVEGNMDVIASHGAGINNVVAVSGTAMTQEHVRILKRYAQHFVLFFDADEAGIVAARRSALICLESDIVISMVLLTEGKDAADIAKDSPDKLREIIQDAPMAIEVFVNIAKDKYDISNPHGKREAVEYVTELISAIPSEVEREEWINRCAKILEVSERAVNNSVKQHLETKKVVQDKQEDIVIVDKTEIWQQSQMQRIYKSIILMMMAYPHVWKYVEKNKEKYGEVMNQRNIQALIREGPECNFSVGEFVSKNPDREVMYTAAMKMQQQYEREHEDGGSPIDDTETYIMIALDVLNKRQIDKLVQQMNEAEINGDYDKQKQLLEQISKLSQQVIRN
jgi:DNA primase